MPKETNVKEIQDAVVIVRKLTRSERMRDMARRLEEGRLDENTRLDDARNEGRAEGRAENIEMTVAFMREKNIPEDIIQAYIQRVQGKQE